MTGSVPSITLSSASHCCPTVARTSGSAKPVTQHVTRQSVIVGAAAAWAKLRYMNRIMRERRLLASLDDNALKDIGLSRADVEREVGRSPLDLPTRRNRWE